MTRCAHIEKGSPIKENALAIHISEIIKDFQVLKY
jgi:hypothetical protein